MSRQTVLVTGATGLLGRQVATTFRLSGWNVSGLGFSRADGVDIGKVNLEETDQVAEVLDKIKSVMDSAIMRAAQKSPDKVDKDPDSARSLNIAASKNLASLAAARDVVMVYISTDYVFPGTPGDAPYEVDATPNPTTLYGKTKLDGEGAVLDEYARAGKQGSAVVLRVPVLYGNAETPGESAVNVLMDAVWKAQTQGTDMVIDDWALRYPTNTEDVGRICRDVAARYLDAADRQVLPRILHFSSQDKATKYEICQRFGSIMGLSTANIKAKREGNDPNSSVQRPYDCHLSTKSLEQLGIDVSTCDFTAWWRREVGAFRK